VGLRQAKFSILNICCFHSYCYRLVYRSSGDMLFSRTWFLSSYGSNARATM